MKVERLHVLEIGNADQVLVSFNMPPNSTMDRKGASSVTIHMSGSKKQQSTIMLAVTADGRKLPPYTVFKRKTTPNRQLLKNYVHVQPKGWMDENLVPDWVCIV